ncbi:MAG: response regulator [Pseudobacteriovorax sp.]|nr:response regulator [Pseudobacteriovorax sp.]
MKTRPKILVVEDDPYIAQIYTEILEDQDFDVILAEHGTLALKLISKHSPELIVMDFMLPDYTGDQLAEKIGDVCPFVFVSGVEEHFLRGREFNGLFLNKPFSSQDLVKAVNESFQSQNKGQA